MPTMLCTTVHMLALGLFCGAAIEWFVDEPNAPEVLPSAASRAHNVVEWHPCHYRIDASRPKRVRRNLDRNRIARGIRTGHGDLPLHRAHGLQGDQEPLRRADRAVGRLDRRRPRRFYLERTGHLQRKGP